MLQNLFHEQITETPNFFKHLIWFVTTWLIRTFFLLLSLGTVVFTALATLAWVTELLLLLTTLVSYTGGSVLLLAANVDFGSAGLARQVFWSFLGQVCGANEPAADLGLRGGAARGLVEPYQAPLLYMLYQGEPKNSSFLSSMDKAALPSMCPCTLESASTPSRLSLCLLDYTTTLGIMAMLWALVSSPTVDHSLFLTHLRHHHDQLPVGGGGETPPVGSYSPRKSILAAPDSVVMCPSPPVWPAWM